MATKQQSAVRFMPADCDSGRTTPDIKELPKLNTRVRSRHRLQDASRRLAVFSQARNQLGQLKCPGALDFPGRERAARIRQNRLPDPGKFDPPQPVATSRR